MHHVVSTDKDAVRLAVNNGLDVQGCDFSPVFWKQTIIELVQEGALSMQRLDDIVSRVLRLKFELGLFERPYTDEEAYKAVIRCEEHKAIALDAARESITLLKNDSVLPLNTEAISSIALIGPSSAAQKIGSYSSIPQFHIPSVLEELKAAVDGKITVRQCDGCGITEEKKQMRVVDGQPHLTSEGEDEIQEQMDEAVQIASSCDVIIMVGGDNTITSGEGRDRCELTLNGKQRELIERLAQLGKPLILVLENGKPLELSVESELCNAIMMTFFGGESGAKAITEALLGKFSPAGRLPISLPRSASRIPCYYSMHPGGEQVFMEGPKNALYAFGHGLSYTAFTYSDLKIVKNGTFDVTVSCTIQNTGTMDGDEVVQLYIDDVDSSVVTPPMLLKGFERISLKAGESKTVTFHLDYDSFKLMNIRYTWAVEPGLFRILVGSSSRDIRLEGEVTL